ncbi:MAG TPA: hypothetical protein PLD20_01330 [Blastocatellia bacterium]|nr:hypothetical protein [Blastocatellia bacterium]HMV83297.1 hypothetical protein [Blastocatellia bacterium]HMX24454.1 hypothetical protein [Blastocatellia bacterium]HMY74604.1 hypothetical protein [Blastocatellia bacterium]HMZ16578.1 hypothetical protein [Blastocatellia bacterium]
MKTSRYLIVLFVLLFGSVSAFAQETEQDKIKKERMAVEIQNQIATKAYSVIEAKVAFETKLVKGAPYSAVTVSESVQMLGDGNRIRQSSTSTVYRDSAGRTRREMMKKDGTLQSIVISDPATGINYTLDPQTRTAMKSEFAGMMKKMAVEQEAMAKKLEAEKKVATAKPVQGVSLVEKRLGESLGRQMFDGVAAEGTRTTVTIPAGQIGNDLPINIISEQWYSPELQLLVMTKHNDPRTGETTYRLTNINRAEPDSSLFEVPSDYTVRTAAALEKEKRVVEELRTKTAKPEEQ